MIKEVIGTGSTIEEATEKAKAELNAPATADVKIEVVALPERKLFIKKPAKVKAYYEIVEEVKKPEKTQQVKKEAPAPVGVPGDKKDYKVAVDYLENIMKGLGVENAQISLEKVEESIFINISCGDDFGVIIGRRGETLDSIQYLVNLVANRDKEDYTRYTINVDNYREKREVTLRNLAKKSAAQVARNGRNVVLEPMNPYERRIIHTTIQEIENVTSHSVGNDNERRVVIQLAEGARPTGGGRYNNNRGGRGGYNNRSRYNNNRGGYNRNNNRNSNSNTVEAPKREPRQDVAGATLYGKIEVNKPQE